MRCPEKTLFKVLLLMCVGLHHLAETKGFPVPILKLNELKNSGTMFTYRAELTVTVLPSSLKKKSDDRSLAHSEPNCQTVTTEGSSMQLTRIIFTPKVKVLLVNTT